MITIDRLETRIESISEKIRALDFNFVDPDLQREAQESLEEALASLENYLDLANTQQENMPETQDESED